MTLLEKILFLQKAMNLDDHEFSTRFHIKVGNFRKFKIGKISLQKNSIQEICLEFNLDFDDFMDDSSTLDKEAKANEHICKLVPKVIKGETILEDFAREDNSRYEEKD